MAGEFVLKEDGIDRLHNLSLNDEPHTSEEYLEKIR